MKSKLPHVWQKRHDLLHYVNLKLGRFKVKITKLTRSISMKMLLWEHRGKPINDFPSRPPFETGMDGIFLSIGLQKILSNDIEHVPNAPLRAHDRKDGFPGGIFQEIMNHPVSPFLRDKFLFPLHKIVTTSRHFDTKHQNKNPTQILIYIALNTQTQDVKRFKLQWLRLASGQKSNNLSMIHNTKSRTLKTSRNFLPQNGKISSKENLGTSQNYHNQQKLMALDI